MIYILGGEIFDAIHNNGDIRKITITKYDNNDNKNIFITFNKQKNHYSIGKIDAEIAHNLMYRKKLSSLPFDKQMDISMKKRKGTLDDNFIFKNIRKTSNNDVIRYIQENL